MAIFNKHPDTPWAEFLKIKEIVIAAVTILSGSYGVIKWVDSRYAKSTELVENIQQLEDRLTKTQCELSLAVMALTNTTVKDKKEKERDSILKQIIVLERAAETPDSKIELYKLRKDLERVESTLNTIYSEENNNAPSSC